MTGSHFAATKNALRRRSHWINAAATANTATVASISPRGKNAEIEPSSSSPQYRSSKPDAAVSRHNPLDGVLSRSVLFTRCPPENPDVSFLIITSLLGSRKSSFCESGDVLAGGAFFKKDPGGGRPPSFSLPKYRTKIWRPPPLFLVAGGNYLCYPVTNKNQRGTGNAGFGFYQRGQRRLHPGAGD